jgi:predicted ATPase
MIRTLAIANYRSILDLKLGFEPLAVITGANGTGKSNLYRALRLLAETDRGGVVSALAREGGLQSTLWAGPEDISRRMEKGEVPIQAVRRKGPIRLRLGFATEDFGYAISLGIAEPNQYFPRDPEIKHEVIWAGPAYRPSASLVERRGASVTAVGEQGRTVVCNAISPFDAMLSQLGDPHATPEVLRVRDEIASWRFYDHFRTDVDAPARHSPVGTFCPVLRSDGSDLPSAIQTIFAIGDAKGLVSAVSDAFPGAELAIVIDRDGRFSVELQQPGLLRPFSAAELSDGTLRYLLWVAALLSPRPPPLLVLNEPETSLHPDLLPALARLILHASSSTQVWVVSHSAPLVSALVAHSRCQSIELVKDLGRTQCKGQGILGQATWHWPQA